MKALYMASLTERAVLNAIASFMERDIELAEQVVKGDSVIDDLENELDAASLKLLALRQPMAKDLRFVVGTMRASLHFERMADQAVNVAERTLYLAHRPPLPPLAPMERLAEATSRMVQNAVRALSDNDVELAMKVRKMDNEADQANVQVLRWLIDYMITESPAADRAVQTIITARCLERIADLSTNVAECVVFIARGVNVKHGYEGV